MMQSSDGRHAAVLDAVVLTHLFKHLKFWGSVSCRVYKLLPSNIALIIKSANIKPLFAEII